MIAAIAPTPAGTASCIACARKRTSGSASAKRERARRRPAQRIRRGCGRRDSAASRAACRSPRAIRRRRPRSSITGCVLTVWLSASAGPSVDERPQVLAERGGRFGEGLAHDRQCRRSRSSCRPTASPVPEIPSRVSSFAHHRNRTEPQVNPPPTPSSITCCPARMRPSRTATSSASGIDAAEVLACRSTVTTIFSCGNVQLPRGRVHDAQVGLVRDQPVDRAGRRVRWRRALRAPPRPAPSPRT